MSDCVSEKSVEALERYHRYLSENYEGGCERFFSPVGFLDDFQRKVELSVQSVRNHVFARNVDEAVIKIEPVVAGKEGVFDLTAEPGTGKTSVLPFRFPSKRVIVALPTPFDAWAAFQMATGDSNLRLKGLTLGSSGAKVTFTDSYLAAKALLSNFLDYDVLIVDECDSPRGVTKFLAEVRAPGKVLIRMSASHGRTESGPSRSFRVTESQDMPDVREGVKALADFVTKEHRARSMVLVPDAETAAELSLLIPQAKVISTKSELSDMARAMVDQKSSKLFIADDTCARGINLNLDALFDCRLIAEHGVLREITKAELYQRRNRVGRNRNGWYYSPSIDTKEVGNSDIDVVRHNVVRVAAGVPQLGEHRLKLTQGEAKKMFCSSKEPYMQVMALRAADIAVTSSSSVSSERNSSRESPRALSRSSQRSRSDSSGSVVAPSWLFSFSGGGGIGVEGVTGRSKSDRFMVKRGDELMYARRKSSSSDSDADTKRLTRVRRSSSEDDDGLRPHRRHRHREGHRALLPIAESAPYAVKERRLESRLAALSLPLSPPVMDLTQLTYDLDWPALIRDRLVHGGDLPTLVPPGSWRHTSVGGVGTDWFRRLDDVAVGDTSFSEGEFEVVCRAWNKLVAQAWVRKTPGLSGASNFDRLEFCARYFQSYFLLVSAE